MLFRDKLYRMVCWLLGIVALYLLRLLYVNANDAGFAAYIISFRLWVSERSLGWARRS